MRRLALSGGGGFLHETPEHHLGKPELVGDEAVHYERNIAAGLTEKPELQSDTSSVPTSAQMTHRNGIQTVPSNVAELPLWGRTNDGSRSDTSQVAELEHQNQYDFRDGKGPVEIGPAASRASRLKRYGAAQSVQRPQHVARGDAYQAQDQGPIPAVVELPVPLSPSSAVAANPPPQQKPAETPLPPSSLPGSRLSSPDQKGREDIELELLRRREQDLADSIAAAENLERLKREHREVQEQIRTAKAGQMGDMEGG